MAGKNKGGKEIRKPKKDKKVKGVAAAPKAGK